MIEQQAAVITGASSGIGAAFARALSAEGYFLLLVARRTERLREVAASLPAGRAQTLALDVRAPGAADRALSALAAHGHAPDLLVNSAGIGDYGPFALADPERLEQVLSTNALALMRFTRAFLPGMIARRRGAIIQVGSGIVFVPASGLAVYAATKAFVDKLGEGLALELEGTGVLTLTLHPGATRSEFFLGANMAQPRRVASADAVAREGLRALRAGKSRHIVGAGNRLGARLAPLLPKRLLARVVERQMR